MSAVRVGDEDPTVQLASNESYCWAPHRLPGIEKSLYCSWELGHTGDHVAVIGDRVAAVWFGENPPTGRVWSPRDRKPWVFGPTGDAGTWTDAMAAEGRRSGVNRQCSIGWHGECSDPAGETCRCACHAHPAEPLPLTVEKLADALWQMMPAEVTCSTETELAHTIWLLIEAEIARVRAETAEEIAQAIDREASRYVYGGAPVRECAVIAREHVAPQGLSGEEARRGE